MCMNKPNFKFVICYVREVSHIDFVHKKCYMDISLTYLNEIFPLTFQIFPQTFQIKIFIYKIYLTLPKTFNRFTNNI